MTAQGQTAEQVTASFLRALKENPTFGYSSSSQEEQANTSTGDNVKVRVLTQNMFIRPPGIKNNENDYKDERLQFLITEVLNDYDVVCLQEMFEFGSNRRKTLINAAKKLGFEYYVASPSKHVWNIQIDGGLMILSRFPIVEFDRITYKRGMMSDWLASKGVLYAKIAIPSPKSSAKLVDFAKNKKIVASENDSTLILDKGESKAEATVEAATHLHLFTTHTQASYGALVDMQQPDVKHRLLQLHQFHNFLENILPKHRKDGEPVVLVGDFNVDSRAHNLPEDSKYEEEIRDGKDTSVEGKAMSDILRGEGIDPSILGPNNKDAFKGKKIFEFEDALYSRHGYHPVTFGNIIIDKDGNVKPRESVLTTKSDNMVMHSIDYLFWYNPGQHQSAKAKLENLAVVPNFISGKPYTQISDHYGVGGIITFEASE
ncbi:hypothetical protein H4219_000578 [Mycoemilia scoparia]|uniref:sphingomyelin phosphodiesterase n=1 Tax=Mycoemilia scoparia TaxID=417184 RepID=A0A9W8A2P5_9FUNG|nr:hypothetical protein H4219_000578 [Mycoemilia scoparia]